MVQRDRSGPQIREKDSSPNQRKLVSKHTWDYTDLSKVVRTQQVVKVIDLGLETSV